MKLVQVLVAKLSIPMKETAKAAFAMCLQLSQELKKVLLFLIYSYLFLFILIYSYFIILLFYYYYKSQKKKLIKKKTIGRKRKINLRKKIWHVTNSN